MKIKYKEAGLESKCFHNRGHPERWSPKDPSDFNSPEWADESAERVGIHMMCIQDTSQEGGDGLCRTEEKILPNQ